MLIALLRLTYSNLKDKDVVVSLELISLFARFLEVIYGQIEMIPYSVPANSAEFTFRKRMTVFC